MGKTFHNIALTLCGFCVSLGAQASLTGVSGPLSNFGDAASIISAPADVRDDAAYNTAQQGFDEIQGYTLLSDLTVDGGSILAGNMIDSHMIFLNSGPGNSGSLLEHFNVEWNFSGDILGVMSDSSGVLEASSSSFLGAAGTIYPGAFSARGLEGRHATCNMNVDDCYNFSGSTLNLTMRVTEPGDWIRVITATSVPEPASLLLLGLGLVGLGVSRRRPLNQ